jgi:hypothetical protein
VLCRKTFPRRGPRNCRSLGFARDDKGEGIGFVEIDCGTEAFFGSETTFEQRSPSPLSFREPLTFSMDIPISCISSLNKAVILSEALHRSIANRGLYGAESKDPGDASWQMPLGAFRPQTTSEDKKVTNSERSRPVPACRGGIAVHFGSSNPFGWIAFAIAYLLENTNSLPSGSLNFAIVPHTSFFGSAVNSTPLDLKSLAVAKTSSHQKVSG